MDQLCNVLAKYINIMYKTSIDKNWGPLVRSADDSTSGIGRYEYWNMMHIRPEYWNDPFELKAYDSGELIMIKAERIGDIEYRLTITGNYHTRYDQLFVLNECKLEIKFVEDIEEDRVEEDIEEKTNSRIPSTFIWYGFNTMGRSMWRREWSPGLYCMLAKNVFRVPIIFDQMQQKDIVYVLGLMSRLRQLPADILMVIAEYLTDNSTRDINGHVIRNGIKNYKQQLGIIGVGIDGMYDTNVENEMLNGVIYDNVDECNRLEFALAEENYRIVEVNHSYAQAVEYE